METITDYMNRIGSGRTDSRLVAQSGLNLEEIIYLAINVPFAAPEPEATKEGMNGFELVGQLNYRSNG